MARSWLLAFVLLLGLCSTAASEIPVPAVARVVDQTGTLTAENRAALERMLEQFETRKGSQIAVVMVKTTDGEPIEQFALRVGEKWKVGRKRVDDGAILVVAKDDRALRIEVGYGLEGALNDATAKRIVSDIIVPRFRENDFFGGISAGVDRMIRVIDGESLPATRAAPAVDGGLFQFLPVLLIAALVVGGVLRAVLGRALGAAATGGVVGFLAWMLAGTLVVGIVAGMLALVFTLVGGFGAARRYGGFPGGFPGGLSGGGLGRGGGGGWGGGGGTFGGGGASGRW
jgi:uncharacterized protein